MRGEFGYHFYNALWKDKDILLLVGDLGYKLFDPHFEDFPDRCINCGASEQAMLDIAVGLALAGKKPFVYSITPFLIYRPFETIRTYIQHEQIPVRLIGSGQRYDYRIDGHSHHAQDVQTFMQYFNNILQYYPQDIKNILNICTNMTQQDSPHFLCLKR